MKNGKCPKYNSTNVFKNKRALIGATTDGSKFGLDLRKKDQTRNQAVTVKFAPTVDTLRIILSTRKCCRKSTLKGQRLCSQYQTMDSLCLLLAKIPGDHRGT